MSNTNQTLKESDALIHSLDFFAEITTVEVTEDCAVYKLRNFRNRDIELVVDSEKVVWCEYVKDDSDDPSGYYHFEEGREPISSLLTLLKSIGHEERYRLEKIIDMTKENHEVAIAGIEYGPRFDSALIALESGNRAHVTTIGDVEHKTAVTYQVSTPEGEQLTSGVFENKNRKGGAKTLAKVLKEY